MALCACFQMIREKCRPFPVCWKVAKRYGLQTSQNFLNIVTGVRVPKRSTSLCSPGSQNIYYRVARSSGPRSAAVVSIAEAEVGSKALAAAQASYDRSHVWRWSASTSVQRMSPLLGQESAGDACSSFGKWQLAPTSSQGERRQGLACNGPGWLTFTTMIPLYDPYNGLPVGITRSKVVWSFRQNMVWTPEDRALGSTTTFWSSWMVLQQEAACGILAAFYSFCLSWGSVVLIKIVVSTLLRDQRRRVRQICEREREIEREREREPNTLKWTQTYWELCPSYAFWFFFVIHSRPFGMC